MQFGYVQGIKRLPLPPHEWKEASNEACTPSLPFPHSLLPFHHNGRKAVQALSKGGNQQRHVVSNVNTAGCGCTSPLAPCPLCAAPLLVVALAFYKRSRNRRKLHAHRNSQAKVAVSVHSEKLPPALPALFERESFAGFSHSVAFDWRGRDWPCQSTRAFNRAVVRPPSPLSVERRAELLSSGNAAKRKRATHCVPFKCILYWILIANRIRFTSQARRGSAGYLQQG